MSQTPAPTAPDPDKQATVPIYFRGTKGLRHRIRQRSVDDDTTINAVIQRAVLAYLDGAS